MLSVSVGHSRAERTWRALSVHLRPPAPSFLKRCSVPPPCPGPSPPWSLLTTAGSHLVSGTLFRVWGTPLCIPLHGSFSELAFIYPRNQSSPLAPSSPSVIGVDETASHSNSLEDSLSHLPLFYFSLPSQGTFCPTLYLASSGFFSPLKTLPGVGTELPPAPLKARPFMFPAEPISHRKV